MSSTMTVLAVLGILFLSTFTRSALGFGDALLAMPLLSVVIGIKTATPLVAFAASAIALTILLRSWHSVDIKAAWRLIVGSLLGIPFGLLLLRIAPETTMTAILGGLLVLFGLYNLIMPPLPEVRQDGLAYAFGFASGILGGVYNTSGPPVVIYGTLRRWEPTRFRATLQCHYLPTSLMVLVGHGIAGLWTPAVLRLCGYALPNILLGVYLGGKLSRFMARDQFNRAVYAVLVITGLLLLI